MYVYSHIDKGVKASTGTLWNMCEEIKISQEREVNSLTVLRLVSLAVWAPSSLGREGNRFVRRSDIRYTAYDGEAREGMHINILLFSLSLLFTVTYTLHTHARNINDMRQTSSCAPSIQIPRHDAGHGGGAVCIRV